MAQIIQFPSGKATLQPVPAAPKPKPSRSAEYSSVTAIKKRVRIPKKNRQEDEGTIEIASLARHLANRSYELAQTEPNSERHRLTLHMSSIADKLPIHNVRVITTPDDVRKGVWGLWQELKIANLEHLLWDARRFQACRAGDEEAEAHWKAKQDEADRERWGIYERMLVVPADSLHDFKTYKLHREYHGGMGCMEWMRRWKPSLAAILDEELARLNAEKEARKAARAAKKGRVQ